MNSDKAIGFLNKVIEGDYDYAYQTYVDPNGRHHNMFTAAGFANLKAGMQEADKTMPDRTFEIKNVFGDGDMIAVHSHFVPKEGDRGLATVHMFKFKDDLIVEMWDLAQPIPSDVPNGDGPF